MKLLMRDTTCVTSEYVTYEVWKTGWRGLLNSFLIWYWN